MFRNRYRFEVRRRDRLLVVRLLGEIDHHSALSLREDLDELILRERPARLVLDLSGIEFMDSSGLGLLMGRYRLMQEIGGVMAIAAPNPAVLRILRLAGMERFMEIGEAPRGEKI